MPISNTSPRAWGTHSAEGESCQNLGQFTTTVVTADVRPRAAELVVVSMHGTEVDYGTEADYVGISQTGRLLVTGQTMIAISNLVPIERMSRDEIRSKLPRRFANKLPSSGDRGISPVAGVVA